ncbi:hypothetical protein PUNSTDRAFT_89783 [Punctularia strigosozonata HHB-11173 SS5]|uniref:uncharacterized protein n=1 Tax=Punctularia strigosozonata (strain HHB-11173) TaxID=741275 RepID=UPI0004417843|nr:uncharacterized protein PUNSTDRAFT_89783 [Punctularia strigosozonata HHB-11173 SS5]EIN07455.1 hypothetical protein PUNSTDRAFT_89783 [Punctularia strigosozonata HHB-11173 SS5]
MSGLEAEPLLPRSEYNPERGDGEAKSRYKRCRRWTAETLEASRMHKFIIALIAIDASCVLTDLAYTILSPTCTPVDGGDSPAWLNITSQISLVITLLFVLEIPLTVWALGWKNYWPFGPVPHASLHFFDGVIIITTFVLEVVLRGKERELAALLVILRLWRLVKLVGGVAVGAGEIQEDNAKHLAETRVALREANERLRRVVEENQQLQAQLRAYQQNSLPASDADKTPTGTGVSKNLVDDDADDTPWR